MGNKEKVYELVCGYISEAEDHTVAGVEVQDEFLEGRLCEKLYEEIYERKKRFVIN